MTQLENGLVLNETTTNCVREIRERFHNADFFKHVLIKDFLDQDFLKNVLDEFPKPNVILRNEFGGASKKHAVHEIRELGATFRAWDDFLKSSTFINVLEQITGISGLLHDPEYHGAGTHNNLDGQGMDTHIDFNLHRTTRYHRRLNLIVYLNEEWDSSWGGSLELHKDPWDVENDQWHSFPCNCNDAVLFETNEYSWHGFERIHLPADKKHLSRKSLTVYYYTKDRPVSEIAPKHGTVYVQKSMPKDIVPDKVLSQRVYDELNSVFQHRNRYLKGLYQRESRLLVKIEALEHRLNQYQTNFRLPYSGHVTQTGVVDGMLPNGKISSAVTATFSSEFEITVMKIIGNIPSYIDSNCLEIVVEGIHHSVHQLVSGGFEVEAELEIGAKKSFEIQIKCEKAVSPFEKNISPDRQKVGFVLQRLCFFDR